MTVEEMNRLLNERAHPFFEGEAIAEVERWPARCVGIALDEEVVELVAGDAKDLSA